jgi:cyclic pyranopterin phosphate synthase
MVDVSAKAVTSREAVASGSITMSRAARGQIRRGAVKKGDPLQAARIAGIMAAKQTAALIPLCHPLPISSVHVDLTPTARGYDIVARHEPRQASKWKALSPSLLTVYDMGGLDKRW